MSCRNHHAWRRVLRLATGWLLALGANGPRAGAEPKPITPEELQRVYAEVRTPYKYGIILRGAPNEMLDCPSVFRIADTWYMMYISITDKVGYETLLAESRDLLHWTPRGKILTFPHTGWDAWQVDGGMALVDPTWGGSSRPEMFEGKYWLSYIGGAKQGYEPDPLAIGMAFTTTPENAVEWMRCAENPVLSTQQPDVRAFEAATLYKSTIIRVPLAMFGRPFVMFYNGKAHLKNHEAIGMAVSRDMVHWDRLGTEPVVDNAPGQPAISGDPQIVKMDDLWVMFYFGHRWRPKAFDTFAVSRDLVHWTKWEGANLIEPSEPWDETFAHKPWLLRHEGVVYHFYCAVGREGRAIAVATSQDLR